MRIVLIVLFSYFSTIATVATAEPTSKNYQTLDLKQFDGLKDQSNVNVKLGLDCTSPSGSKYKSGQTGYEQCVRDSQKSGTQQNGERKGDTDIQMSFGK